MNYRARREAWYAARHTAPRALSAPVLDIFAGHGWGTAYEKACILVPVSPKRRDKQ